MLLSIVIPTYNRYEYLEGCLLSLAPIICEDVEVVVQDNSENNEPMVGILSRLPGLDIAYCHDATKHFSQTENSERALERARGDYVLFIGDDDSVAQQVPAIAAWMREEGLEALTFPGARYCWPDVVSKRRRMPSRFAVPSFSSELTMLDPKLELSRCASAGASDLGSLPRVYHGLASRRSLLAIKDRAGAFFPGPSPDMASSSALALVIDRYGHLDIPLFVDGFSFKSAGGRSLRDMHKGNLNDIDQLPDDIANEWNPAIPAFWLGETIWCQSYWESMRRMGKEDDIDYSELYARIVARHPDCISYVTSCIDTSSMKAQVMFKSSILFMNRCIGYLNRIIKTKARGCQYKCAFEVIDTEGQFTIEMAASKLSEILERHIPAQLVNRRSAI